jgi:hypothetical protein
MERKISRTIAANIFTWTLGQLEDSYLKRSGHRAYMALVGKPEGRRPLGRPRRRWEDNIKMDLREVGCGGSDWINLAQDRDRWRALVYTVNLRVP